MHIKTEMHTKQFLNIESLSTGVYGNDEKCRNTGKTGVNFMLISVDDRIILTFAMWIADFCTRIHSHNGNSLFLKF